MQNTVKPVWNLPKISVSSLILTIVYYMMNAVLITIGDEILSGNTVDTNSNFIASQLKNIGISVAQIFTVSDEIETIKKTLKSAFEIGNIVITTGGLGPTKDDKTKTRQPTQFFCHDGEGES